MWACDINLEILLSRHLAVRQVPHPAEHPRPRGTREVLLAVQGTSVVAVLRGKLDADPVPLMSPTTDVADKANHRLVGLPHYAMPYFVHRMTLQRYR